MLFACFLLVLGFTLSLTLLKDKSSRYPVSRDVRHSPYKSHGRGSEGVENSAEQKEWEDAICPICLEYPHNAVLLLCSSHEKGCRPYVCDTSHRHSNCLDQYRKAQVGMKNLESSRLVVGDVEQSTEHLVLRAGSAMEPLNWSVVNANSSALNHRATRRALNIHNQSSNPPSMCSTSDDVVSLRITGMDSVFAAQRSRRNIAASASHSTGMRSSNCEENLGGAAQGIEQAVGAKIATEASPSKKADVKDLLCPLCRGEVSGWKVVEGARKRLNGKSRSSSQESCSFVGSYEELRAHARCEHPLVRLSQVDPARTRDWQRMERQRDMGDVLSSICSAMPGAAVFGDYGIEDDLDIENGDMDLLGDEGHWWRVFFLFQIFGPAASVTRERSLSSRIWPHQHRQRRARTARLREWVENFNNRIGNEATGGSNISGGEHIAETPRRQRNQRRHWRDMS